MNEYKTKQRCSNCYNMVELTIPLGIRVKEFLKGKKCEICGCDMLSQYLVIKEGNKNG